ncbi:hypothetical protein MKX07_006033 [Trichoderma sp. CBMAI-0711]|nr:hypothetical protein MKX07_006033 [Trichoderma sp. CBMAI-0711]
MSTNFRPSGTIGSLDEYLKALDSLVSAEKALGYESLVKGTPLESTAEEIIYRLKEWKDRNVYGIKSDGSGHEAGQRFFHGLDLVSDSKLAHALPQFGVFAQAAPPAETNMFHETYVSGLWMRYSSFLQRFPGGVAKAETWLYKRMVLQPDDAYHQKQTVNGAFGKNFVRAVTVIRSMLGYETAYREHFRRALWKFAQDGIMYAEIRVALDYGFFIRSGDGIRDIKQREALQILQEVLRKETPKIRAAGHLFYGAKFIYACMRSSSRDATLWCMINCIEMKQLFPDLICGFDSQGQEDTGHPLSYWVPDLLEMRAKITALNIDLSFILHAGETLDHGGETDSNLYDAILLDTKRIGHGFSITKHPLLMQICKERRIAIETCPISNEVLGLVPTTKSHHLPVLLANCVPCTVNSDDPGSWQ